MATSCPRGRGKNKQYWNDEEAEVLVNVLQELACDPLWKVEGGFKNNYMVELHKRLVLKLPNFDKDVNPHIDSRIKYLRNKYNPISEMLTQKECQWDDIAHKIKCEKQWYDDWCKNHKNAIGLWNLKFPYLRKLDLVWGKDKATRLKAVDISQACEDNFNKKNGFVCSSDSEDKILVASEAMQDAQASPTTSSSTHTSKKRKKLSPRKERFYKNKQFDSHTQTIDARLDDLLSKFESVCGQMMSQYVAIKCNPNFFSDEMMQEVVNELVNIGLSQKDVGKAA
ncbi:Myb/SANT-like domain-containing protein [Cynara cardunculus var. scolymus]|uniref:Myb/SANT-like domain-containing protein n=1 Tax=Cynara cardunculus var. scolymus TaxID=59895 RepID=A0A118K0L4_CYNCS|nr:Myb/SANT-like domain-containing protein [Cynara cardunculus var. scolymus]